MSRTIALLVFAAATLLVFLAGQECSAVEKEKSSFEKTVKPFLAKHCFDCHSGDEAEAQFDLRKLPTDFSTDSTAGRWIDVMHSLQFGEMPPVEETRPNPIQQANVIDWVLQKMAETRRYEAYRRKMLAPEYGNWVSHEKLFSGEIDTPPFSPSRLWRFSPAIFGRKGFGRARSPYTYVTAETGIRDYSAMSKVDQSTVQMILLNANQFLEHREGRGEFKQFAEGRPTPSNQVLAATLGQEFRRVIGREPNQEEQARYLAFLNQNIKTGGNLDGLKTTIKAMFLSPEAIYRMEFGLGETDEHGRRHLSPKELEYAVSYALTDQQPEHSEAIRTALHRGQLTNGDEVAAVVRDMLDLGMNQKRTPRIIRFFEEYFGYHRAGSVFKDMARVRTEDVRQWNSNRITYEAQQLVEHLINRDKRVIEELLTSNRFFVAHPGDNALALAFYEEAVRDDYVELKVQQKLDHYALAKRNPQGEGEKQELTRIRKQAEERFKVVRQALDDGLTPFPGWPYDRDIRGLNDLIYLGVYNLPATSRVERQKWDWVIEQPMELPREQRAGMLTHPAWLAAHSLNDGNDPIRRGIWVRTKLLAGVIQDVPPDVDANVANDPHKTLRERMEPLRAERCWRCHRKMNPLGETFEVFDDWGRYRTHVYFDEDNKLITRRDGTFKQLLKQGKLTSREIDASGSITGSGDSDVDGEVKDAIEMLHRLGHSARARQSFIRHLFRYFMGRNEMLSDSRTLVEAEQAYLDNNGSFKALVVSLLSSDSFLYRR